MSDSMDLDNFEPVAKIVVIGVGGGGNNAVNRMIDNIQDVEFWVLNTDKQALATSKSSNRMAIGDELTGGLGAGGDPAVGKEAALQSEEDIREIVKGKDLVFIAAGMGGGTGTGAAPIVASIAKEEGALTVAVVTRPFTFEGKRRIGNSVTGLNELKDAVDSIIIVSNDKLLSSSGKCPVDDAFGESDRVLAQSVQTVTDLILRPALINLDFADVKATLKGSGLALIGFGTGSGPDKAMMAAENAINSPLLEASISGARKLIVAVTAGSGVSLFDAQECATRIAEAAGSNVDMMFGVSVNPAYEDMMVVSVIASDFSEDYDFTSVPKYTPLSRDNVGSGVASLKERALQDVENSEKRSGENEEDIKEKILPNFLKDALGSNED